METRVLVVEDLRQSRELISELMLLVGGFRVVGSCATEGQALEWLHDHPGGADLVILDLMLREGSGYSVLTLLADRGRPEVVVFSDFVSPAVARQCRSQGALDVISKADWRALRVFLEDYRGRQREAA